MKERVPTLQYGPGDARLAHGPDEAVALDEVVTTARTPCALVALDVCGSRSGEARGHGDSCR